MLNKKSKASAILVLVSALLFVVFLTLLPFLQYEPEEGDNTAVIKVPFIIVLGYPLLYAAGVPYVIVALIFGLKMLKTEDKQKLISSNKSMFIASCVLLILFAMGMSIAKDLIFHTTLGLFPIIFTAVLAAVCVAAMVVQIVTISKLKKQPDQPEPTDDEV